IIESSDYCKTNKVGITLGADSSELLVGSILFTNNSNQLVGTGTSFTSIDLGEKYIKRNLETAFYKIKKIIDNTHIELFEDYSGITGSDSGYVSNRSVAVTGIDSGMALERVIYKLYKHVKPADVRLSVSAEVNTDISISLSCTHTMSEITETDCEVGTRFDISTGDLVPVDTVLECEDVTLSLSEISPVESLNVTETIKIYGYGLVDSMDVKFYEKDTMTLACTKTSSIVQLDFYGQYVEATITRIVDLAESTWYDIQVELGDLIYRTTYGAITKFSFI
ncbi:MAG TPA: hypothetical protein VI775_00165, partial [Candidatus Paceibacterota bacterium]